MRAGEIPESVVKMQCWGSVKSSAIVHYAHLTSKDIDTILLSHAGLKVAQKPSDTSLNRGNVHTVEMWIPPNSLFQYLWRTLDGRGETTGIECWSTRSGSYS